MSELNSPVSRSLPEKYEKTCAFTTTGQFEHVSGGFTAHCGPVAVTNIILTYWMRHGRPDLDPKEVFLKTARFGASHLLYVNRQILKTFGGTSDVLSGVYLRSMLHEFGIYNLSVTAALPVSPALAKRALKQDEIIYLQLRHHPKYGNHHLVLYGSYGTGADTRFIAADGWERHPVLLAPRDLRLGSFRSISWL